MIRPMIGRTVLERITRNNSAICLIDHQVGQLMSENPLEAIERLEKLAAWHRINAEHAGADWVWEARLRAAEDLERRAAKIRGQLSSGS
jgi:hypothetical protein